MTSKRTHVFSGSIYEELAGYARAVVVDDWIFVSGTVGVDFETGQMAEGSETQTSTALDTIEKALLEAESGLHDIVRVRAQPSSGVAMWALSQTFWTDRFEPKL
jgi:enamine deaminase RidA (YjgF/YER057c/UK114 family)